MAGNGGFKRGMPVRLDPPALPGWEPAFAAVREQAAKRGLRALVVGGYVRDRLLGGDRERQIREVDILVEGKGAIQLATDVARAMNVHPPVVFERFGTAHLDFDHHALEFVSSRVETYDPSSRKPQVSPGTLKEDVVRRDFTVNTLLMDWDGTVLDLTGRGLAVREADCAEAAVSIVEQDRPDLILLDINLPHRTGWDLLRELHRRQIEVPTIVISAVRASPSRITEFHPLAYLPKPFPIEALLRLVFPASERGRGEVARNAES